MYFFQVSVQVITAGCPQVDVAFGDTVNVFDNTRYHVFRVVPSTSSLIIHPDFDSRRPSNVMVSAFWAPPKPMTTSAVNTGPIVECNICSLVAFLVLLDAMDIATSTSPLIGYTIGCNTDSVEVKEFDVLLREGNEIEKLEAQVKGRKMNFPDFESL